jgi:hypothetical protein
MSWRAFRTVCQADLVRLHLIFNIWEGSAIGVGVGVAVAAHDVSCPVSPVRF